MWYEKDEPKLNCTGHNHAHASDGLLEITPTPKINIDEVIMMISLLRYLKHIIMILTVYILTIIKYIHLLREWALISYSSFLSTEVYDDINTFWSI